MQASGNKTHWWKFKAHIHFYDGHRIEKSIFRVFDEVEKSGVAKEVTRKGKWFLITPLDKKNPRIENWEPKKKVIIGDPDDLVDFKVWDIEKDWREPDILDGIDE